MPAAGWPGQQAADPDWPAPAASLVSRRGAAPGLRRGVGRGRAGAMAGCEGTAHQGRNSRVGRPGGSGLQLGVRETREGEGESRGEKMKKTEGRMRTGVKKEGRNEEEKEGGNKW